MKASEPIFLIGMMGSGKTSVGRELASLLDRKFVDLDFEIEKGAGLTIPEIFEKRGEPYFRKLETLALERFGRQERTVVSTGGGIVLKPANVEFMRFAGLVIFLEAAPETLCARLKDSSAGRPLLQTPDWKQTVLTLCREREPLYRAAAYYCVATDGKTDSQTASEIQKILEEHASHSG